MTRKMHLERLLGGWDNHLTRILTKLSVHMCCEPFCVFLPAVSPAKPAGMWILEPTKVRYVNSQVKESQDMAQLATSVCCADKGRLFVLMKDQTIAKIEYNDGINTSYGISPQVWGIALFCKDEELWVVGECLYQLQFDDKSGHYGCRTLWDSLWRKFVRSISGPAESLVFVAAAVDSDTGNVFRVTSDGKLLQRGLADSQDRVICACCMRAWRQRAGKSLGKVRMIAKHGYIAVLVSDYMETIVSVYSYCGTRVTEQVTSVVRAFNLEHGALTLVVTDADGRDSLRQWIIPTQSSLSRRIEKPTIGYAAVDTGFLSWDNSALQFHARWALEEAVGEWRCVKGMCLDDNNDYNKVLEIAKEKMRSDSVLTWGAVEPGECIAFIGDHFNTDRTVNSIEELQDVLKEYSETLVLAVAATQILMENGDGADETQLECFKAESCQISQCAFKSWHGAQIFRHLQPVMRQRLAFYLESPYLYDSLQPQSKCCAEPAYLAALAHGEAILSQMLNSRVRYRRCVRYFGALLIRNRGIDDNFYNILQEFNSGEEAETDVITYLYSLLCKNLPSEAPGFASRFECLPGQ